MALPVENGDVLSARVWSTFGDQAAVNTYNYVAFSVSGGIVTDQDLANSVDVIVNGTYKGLMTTDATYDGVQVYYRQRTLGNLPAPVAHTASAGPGLQPPPTVPAQVAGIMKYVTNVRGPGGRGRVYLPFLATDLVANDGLPTVAFDSAVNAMATLLLTPITIVIGGATASFYWALITRLPGPTVLYSNRQIIQAKSAQKFGQLHKRGNYGRTNQSPI